MNEVQRGVLERLKALPRRPHRMDLSGLLLRVITADREAAEYLEGFFAEHEAAKRSVNESTCILLLKFMETMRAALDEASPADALDSHDVEVAFNALWWWWFVLCLDGNPNDSFRQDVV